MPHDKLQHLFCGALYNQSICKKRAVPFRVTRLGEISSFGPFFKGPGNFFGGKYHLLQVF